MTNLDYVDRLLDDLDDVVDVDPKRAVDMLPATMSAVHRLIPCTRGKPKEPRDVASVHNRFHQIERLAHAKAIAASQRSVARNS
jgi:hypothetical protein